MTNCCITLALITRSGNYFSYETQALLRACYYLAQSPTLIDDIITFDGWFCLPGCRLLWKILFKVVSMFAPKQQGYGLDSWCLWRVWEEPVGTIAQTRLIISALTLGRSLRLLLLRVGLRPRRRGVNLSRICNKGDLQLSFEARRSQSLHKCQTSPWVTPERPQQILHTTNHHH